MPSWFFIAVSAPSASSSFTASFDPYIAAIISGVVPLGDWASMKAWFSSSSFMIDSCPLLAA
ncbi:hypothetical protein D3C86_605580 [compost metagenome]